MDASEDTVCLMAILMEHIKGLGYVVMKTKNATLRDVHADLCTVYEEILVVSKWDS